MARQRVKVTHLAGALGWSINTTRRRLDGTYPFDIDQLAAVARFLGRPIVDFLPDSERAA